tara:strand:+ start:15804 stop:16784 length:981 start_codon:yes stop_codon:yes gene_type:complete
MNESLIKEPESKFRGILLELEQKSLNNKSISNGKVSIQSIKEEFGKPSRIANVISNRARQAAPQQALAITGFAQELSKLQIQKDREQKENQDKIQELEKQKEKLSHIGKILSGVQDRKLFSNSVDSQKQYLLVENERDLSLNKLLIFSNLKVKEQFEKVSKDKGYAPRWFRIRSREPFRHADLLYQILTHEIYSWVDILEYFHYSEDTLHKHQLAELHAHYWCLQSNKGFQRHEIGYAWGDAQDLVSVYLDCYNEFLRLKGLYKAGQLQQVEPLAGFSKSIGLAQKSLDHAKSDLWLASYIYCYESIMATRGVTSQDVVDFVEKFE